ncbi:MULTISPECIES: hypothetical protein [unclassified Pseudomonas]|uniref:hypothetical protein n=1 Tax=unclassified Pseudomonas TaxID=196821 RepID=UPI00215EC703|nr:MULTISPECIES: hypothetical protein [unclassified Pseudomonas]UVM50354.1 hypothetical protein LOY38_29305 [Pseudomonas sp. B21-015]WPN57905.1 hypothetical protein QMK51_28025 [Pseudomonas sp. P9_31]
MSALDKAFKELRRGYKNLISKAASKRTAKPMQSARRRWRGQVGYKWTGESNKTQLNGNWPAHFLVSMDDICGGKPVIAVTDTLGTRSTWHGARASRSYASPTSSKNKT